MRVLFSGELKMYQKIQKYIASSDGVMCGKTEQVQSALCCLFAGGHLLIEDIPGVGKTTLVKFLAHSLGLQLGRIQFTNDLLPSDILGVTIFNRNDQNFHFHKGAIFNEIVLADELNRATPKTQSALLQVMEEHKVSIDGETYPMSVPFMVIATQNPRHHIGTNSLPESQLDRFLMKIEMGFPSRESEKALIAGDDRMQLISQLEVFLNKDDLLEGQKLISQVFAASSIENYILDILQFSRRDKSLQDLSPRVGIHLMQAAKSWAFMQGRDHVMPADVQKIAPKVIGHRLASAKEGAVEFENSLAQNLLSQIPVF